MKTIAIISEYNPFHTGHQYQIDHIREKFGTDTRIISIMSGNFTQRGDLSVFDMSARAEAAVRAGVDLVLLLPFPYSMSSAEYFAGAGVYIADSLGVVDYLAFGSECGDISKLESVVDNILSNKFYDTLKDVSRLREDFMMIYNSNIPGYDDTLKKINAIEKKLIRNQNKISIVKKNLKQSKKLNEKKIIKVRELNEKEQRRAA